MTSVQSTLPIEGSNYVAFIQDHEGAGLGQVTLRTGAAHPLASRSLLYGGASGQPGTSFFTVRSYTSRTDYVQRVGSALSSFAVMGLDSFGEIAASTPQGIVTNYSLPGGTITPDRLLISQTVELLNSFGVGVTVTITNLGTDPVALGFRALWDVQLDSQDGPALVSADGSLLTHETTLASAPRPLRLAATVLSSTGLMSLWLTDGSAGQIGLISVQADRFQYAAWPAVFATAFDYTTDPTRVVAETPGADSAIVYYFGATEPQAFLLEPGASASVAMVFLTALSSPGRPLATVGLNFTLQGNPPSLTVPWGTRDTVTFTCTTTQARELCPPALSASHEFLATMSGYTLTVPNSPTIQPPEDVTFSISGVGTVCTTTGVCSSVFVTIPYTVSFTYFNVDPFQGPLSLDYLTENLFPRLAIAPGCTGTLRVTLTSAPGGGSFTDPVVLFGAYQLWGVNQLTLNPGQSGFLEVFVRSTTPPQEFLGDVLAVRAGIIHNGLRHNQLADAGFLAIRVPDFSIFVAGSNLPATNLVSQSTPISFNIQATKLEGGCQDIRFEVTAPGQITGTNPVSVSGGSTAVTVDTSTLLGPTSITVTARSGPLAHSLTLPFTVTPQPVTLSTDDRAVTSVPSAQAVSPFFAPPQATDRMFVGFPDRRDQYLFADRPTGATNPGVFTITVLVSRVVGNVDANGFLTNATTLIANGVLASTATLEIMAFDVDAFITQALRDQGVSPEAVTVEFNGSQIGTLKGGDGIWFGTRFTVPIQTVRFPTRPPLGQAPTPVLNTVVIRADNLHVNPSGVLNPGQFSWATAVDWAALSIKAMSPVVLIHGQRGSRKSWDDFTPPTQFTPEFVPGFAPLFVSLGIPFEAIDLPEPPVTLFNGIYPHGEVLAGLLRDIARRYGVNHLHLVAHSKGGLDARVFLARYGTIFEQGRVDPINPQGQRFKILSLTTIGTPHRGTIGSDSLLLIDELVKILRYKLQSDITLRLGDFEAQGIPRDEAETLAGAAHVFLSKFQLDEGVRDTTAESMDRFNREEGNLSNLSLQFPGTAFLAISGDADQNRDGTIQFAETRGLEKNFANPESIYTATYRFLRDVSTVTGRVEEQTREYCILYFFGCLINVKVGYAFIVVVATSTTSPQQNDTRITQASANPGLPFRPLAHFAGSTGRNHITLIEDDVAKEVVLPALRVVEQTIGGFR